MGARVLYYCIQDSRKFSICGKRRKCGKPNSHASFILQATSDEMRVLFLYGHLCFCIRRKLGVKECDGTHSEYCARRVPTLRNERNT